MTKDFQIKNLTTKIKHKTINEIEAEIIKGQFLNLELSGSKVEFKNENNAKKIKTELHTSGEVNFSQIKNILTLFNLENNYFTNINLIADLKTNIDFEINNKFKIKNLKYSIKGVINQLKLNNKENLTFEESIEAFKILMNGKLLIKKYLIF